MLNDEICKLRDQLNESILNGEDYEKILEISVNLDQLIAEHYRINIRQNNEVRKHAKTEKNNQKQTKYTINEKGYAI